MEKSYPTFYILHLESFVTRSHPSSVTEHCDGLRVASEAVNVLLYPLEGGYLVHQAVVGHLRLLVGSSVSVEEAEEAQPVVDGHHDDVAVGSQHATVVYITGSPAVGLSVHEDHHWQSSLG